MPMFTDEDVKPEEFTDLKGEDPSQVLEEGVRDSLKAVIDQLLLEDQEQREELVKLYKLCELYWRGIQAIFWSQASKNWKSIREELMKSPRGKISNVNYDKIINIYRAHGESIIAALSSSLPAVRFFPKDAENPNDVMTAETFSRCAEYLMRQNKAPLLFMKALYTLFNQSFAASYTYYHSDKKYGVVSTPIYDSQMLSLKSKTCTECGDDITDAPVLQEATDMAPEMVECATCGQAVEPYLEENEIEIPIITGMEDTAKGKQCLEVYGPLNVRIPASAANVDECPYLILEMEMHYAKLRSMYQESRDEIGPGDSTSDYERWARSSNDYDDSNINLVTWRRAWLRPWAYEILDADEADKLKKLYPDGCMVTMVGDNVIQVERQILDEHWTITQSPTSRTLHADPIGKPCLPMQEWKNEVSHLKAETLRHGIPQTFADTEVLDFQKYKNAEIKPGVMFPVKRKNQQASLDAAFYTTKTASFPPEMVEYERGLDRDTQFVLGDFPSLFGGPNQGKTLGEYQESRAQALQRLSIVWKVLNEWWPTTLGKAVQSFVTNLVEDEKFTKKQGSSFINVWIRRAELTGEVGEIESESSEQLPISWAQKRGVLLELIGLNRDEIIQAILGPDNIEMVKELMGLPELTIPGEQDRMDELIIISELLKGEPIVTQSLDPMTGMPIEDMAPSVPINPDLEEPSIRVQTCRNWLLSDVGRDAKVNNEAGYANVMARLKAHLMAEQQKMAAQMPPEDTAAPPTPGGDFVEDNGAVEPPQSGRPGADEV